ncbi:MULTISPECIES: efflux RND transporter periplasmic adaptor subunit [unclassified Marinobacter]|uniref:efflux RND transporter periplasmic adaptor subunit n=1 Tax=unclassified Marinobacter TaxID=83889 RepID=UPI0019285D92|nr:MULTISPECIES: HlyD family efflux transporter periplasmic adaptor subunit [unclassified Marinobacter]MBL3825367.1 HlyD family efflux transporter periplasmic adaptor subunit [Marinobacter sp. MC3]MBL3893873.1 HlyD family efflux transporter periplasmic adaptor subunit [Marinobacter sp. MW3]
MAKKGFAGKWLFWGVFVLLAIAAVVVTIRPDPVWVDLAPVTRGPMEITIKEEGKTRVRDRYVVSSPVAGYLHRVLLEVGDPVIPGELLTEVDPMPASTLDARSRAEAEAKVQSARSALNSTRQKVAAAEAEADLAVRELARLQALSDDHFVSDERLQQARAAADRAKAILRSARFDEEVMAHELAAARTRLEVSAARANGDGAVERVPVRSPVNGSVLGIARKSEGVIQAGEAILELGDPGALEVVVDVLSFDAVNLRPGIEARLTGWGGGTLDAVVRRVEPVGFEDVSALGVEERRVQVVADITSPPDAWQSLGDGYRVDAEFLLWRSDNVLQVPESAIFVSDGQHQVFRVVDNRAVLTNVSVGRTNGFHTVIQDGLGEADRVVRHPDRQLEDGSQIRVR